MVTLIGNEVGMALPTTALFDYPSAEALAYFIASAQVWFPEKTLNSQPTSTAGQQSLANHPSAEALPILQNFWSSTTLRPCAGAVLENAAHCCFIIGSSLWFPDVSNTPCSVLPPMHCHLGPSRTQPPRHSPIHSGLEAW